MLAVLLPLNPLLQNDAPPHYPVARRHFIVDAHGKYPCRAFFGADGGDDSRQNRTRDPRGGKVARMSIEVRTTKSDFAWYTCPYPSLFHGQLASQTPARLRPKGRSKYLWSNSAGLHGSGAKVRGALRAECDADADCHGKLQIHSGGELARAARLSWVRCAHLHRHLRHDRPSAARAAGRCSAGHLPAGAGGVCVLQPVALPCPCQPSWSSTACPRGHHTLIGLGHAGCGPRLAG